MKIATTIAAITLLASAATAHAGDCRQVRFNFTNAVEQSNIPVDVRVLKINIDGNDGSWTENIGNKKIVGGDSHRTNKRRLNKLDSGARGDFEVIYKRRNLGSSGWTTTSQSFNDQLCWDGRTFFFSLTNM